MCELLAHTQPTKYLQEYITTVHKLCRSYIHPSAKDLKQYIPKYNMFANCCQRTSATNNPQECITMD